MLARDKNKSTIIEYDKPSIDNHLNFEEFDVKSGKSEKKELFKKKDSSFEVENDEDEDPPTPPKKKKRK